MALTQSIWVQIPVPDHEKERRRCYVSKDINEKTSGDVESIKVTVEYELANGQKKTVSWDMENVNISESRDFDVDTGKMDRRGLSIDGDIKIKESEYDDVEQ